ncbi:MAG: tRNA pseudouridine(55) synthase TruB [Pyrinomonadaceae bacterium]
MDGILIIDKPAGLTSHDVVARVRRILRTKRVGHTGTLDPFATGVLVLVIGSATRLARFLDKDAKEYTAEVQFGFETDTGDRTGTRSAECGMRNEEIEERISTADWESVFSKFRGELLQTPPMYSAKKIAGKKLYELAREGKEIERKPVPVLIRELALIPNEIDNPQSTIRIRVLCSAGTYIRTLAEDIGREVGVGAHLTNLRRTAAGKFDLSRAATIEDLDSSPTPADALLPAEFAVSHLPEFVLPDDRIGPTKNGLPSRTEEGKYNASEFIRMTGSEGAVIAVGIYDDDEKVIRPKVVLI